MNSYDKAVRRRAQTEDVLRRMGGTHTVEDVLDAINKGTMQSFSDGDTWVVTQVIVFPQKRVLEIFLVVGTLEGVQRIEPAVMDFAKQVEAGLVRAFGRDGWLPVSKGYGWHDGMRVYWKEI